MTRTPEIPPARWAALLAWARGASPLPARATPGEQRAALVAVARERREGRAA